jgi:hypothetical protein
MPDASTHCKRMAQHPVGPASVGKAKQPVHLVGDRAMVWPSFSPAQAREQ